MATGFKYTVKAHPTVYEGVRFRSRLEARYAAFFDYMHWEWEYEPIDLNGWSPDFVLKGAARNVFVEVKPYPLSRLPFDEDTQRLQTRITAALEGSGERALILFRAPAFEYLTPALGAALYWANNYPFWGAANAWDVEGGTVDITAMMLHPSPEKGIPFAEAAKAGALHITGDMRGYLTDNKTTTDGAFPHPTDPGLKVPKAYCLAYRSWIEAGNTAQWRGQRRG